MASSAERMRRKRQRDKDRGLVQVTVTVPAERAEELRVIAEVWESEHRSRSARKRLEEMGQGSLLSALDTVTNQKDLSVTGDAKKKKTGGHGGARPGAGRPRKQKPPS